MRAIHLILITIFLNIFSVSRYEWDHNYFSDNFVVREVKNIFDLNMGIFSKDSLKVLGCTLPIYFLSKTMDKDVHRCFYQRSGHKNINQPNKYACDFVHKSFVPLLCGFAGYSLFFGDEHLKLTGEVYLAGVLSIWGAKNIIKNGFEWDCCKRPWNEHFDRKKRAYGGFPSGHIAEAVYLTGLYGSQYGWRIGAPLIAYTGLVWGFSLACNRHYFSQLVGGTALGAIYACAATKLVDKRLNDRLSLSCGCDANGYNNFSCEYTF